MRSTHVSTPARLAITLALTFAFALTTTTTSRAQPTTSSTISNWWNGEYASGDWGGTRQHLENRGIHLWLNYEQDFAGNITGGNSRGVTNSGSFDFGTLLDLDKLASIPDTTLFIRFVDRNGTDLSARRIGNFFPVQQDFGVETLMLQSLALEYHFPDTNFSLKFGRVAAGDDFSGAAVYGLYMNNAINGAPKILFTTNAFSSYPGSVWGARLAYTAPSDTWYAKAGIYQADDRLYTGEKHGFQWDIRHDDGVTLVSEIGYTPGKNSTDPAILPGNYHIGAYISYWDIPRIDGHGLEDTSYAIYLHADQMVWRDNIPAGAHPNDAPAITAWATAAFAPKDDVQILTWQVSAGVSYRGVIPTRPHDEAVFGISHGHFGNDHDIQQQAATGESATGETMLELAYRIKLNRFNILQPDIQYIMNPMGLSSRSNALVLGIRLYVTF